MAFQGVPLPKPAPGGQEVERPMASPGAARITKGVVELAASAVAVPSLVLLLRQAVLAGTVATLGLDSAWHLVQRRWLGSFMVERSQAALLALAVVPGASMWARALRRRSSPRAAALVWGASVGLALLGWSYRLPALVALALFAAWSACVRSPAGGGERRAVALVLLLCLSPVDVSMQQVAGPPRAVRAVNCEYGGLDVLEGHAACVGVWIYHAPRWLWVW